MCMVIFKDVLLEELILIGNEIGCIFMKYGVFVKNIVVEVEWRLKKIFFEYGVLYKNIVINKIIEVYNVFRKYG